MFKGITDLGGIGRVVGECRKFVMDFLRHRAGHKERELKNTEQALKNDALRLKNEAAGLKNQAAALQLHEQVFTIAKKRGWSSEQTQELIIRLASAKQFPDVKPESEARPNPIPKLLGDGNSR